MFVLSLLLPSARANQLHLFKYCHGRALDEYYKRSPLIPIAPHALHTPKQRTARMASRRHTGAAAGGRGGAGESLPLLGGNNSSSISPYAGAASAAGGGNGKRGAYGSGEQHKALTDDPPDLGTFNQASSMYHLPSSRRRSSWVVLVRGDNGGVDGRSLTPAVVFVFADPWYRTTNAGEAPHPNDRHPAEHAETPSRAYVTSIATDRPYATYQL